MSKNKKCKTQKIIQEVKINVPGFVRPPDPPIITYERIQIPLLQPPGVIDLPPAIFFDIDNRFTDSLKIKIRDIIAGVQIAWNRHYIETIADGTSDWAACTEMYATKKLTPVWLDEEKSRIITNGKLALEFAMDTLTSFFRQNGNLIAPIAKIKYQESSDSTIFGENGKSKEYEDLTVTVNPLALDGNSINLTGSLVHAWMHRMGYRHPKGIYTTYLIGEAPMCLMRGYQNKVPGQPDSIYTKYFD